MKVAIVNKADGSIVSMYDGEPNQGNYGGPWGRPEDTTHIQIPNGMIADASVLVITDGVITEDATAKAAYLVAAQIRAVTAAVIRAKAACAQLEVDFMTENSILGIKLDGLAVKQAVLAKMQGVNDAIKVGDPDLVIDAIQAILPGAYDVKYVTAVRLLAAGNKIRISMGKTAVLNITDLAN